MDPSEWEKVGSIADKEDKGVMVSNLPLLFASSEPVYLQAMTQRQLERFVGFMVRCSLDAERTTPLSELHKPEWWPTALAFRVNSEAAPTPTTRSMLQRLVERCYQYHGCEFLLAFCRSLYETKPDAGYTYVQNRDGTSSMFNKNKLLVTFRNENREYDRVSMPVKQSAKLNRQLYRPQLLPRRSFSSVEVPPVIQDVFLCDRCDSEFATFKEVQAHERQCEAEEPEAAQMGHSTPPPSLPTPATPPRAPRGPYNRSTASPCDTASLLFQSPTKCLPDCSYPHDPTSQEERMSQLGLIPTKRLQEYNEQNDYTNGRANGPHSSIRKFSRAKHFKYDTVDVASPLGRRLRALYWNPSNSPSTIKQRPPVNSFNSTVARHSIERYERYTSARPDDEMPVTRDAGRGVTRWVNTYNQRRGTEPVWTHAFAFCRSEMRLGWGRVELGLTTEAVLLYDRLCRPARVRVKRLRHSFVASIMARDRRRSLVAGRKITVRPAVCIDLTSEVVATNSNMVAVNSNRAAAVNNMVAINSHHAGVNRNPRPAAVRVTLDPSREAILQRLSYTLDLSQSMMQNYNWKLSDGFLEHVITGGKVSNNPVSITFQKLFGPDGLLYSLLSDEMNSDKVRDRAYRDYGTFYPSITQQKQLLANCNIINAISSKFAASIAMQQLIHMHGAIMRNPDRCREMTAVPPGVVRSSLATVHLGGRSNAGNVRPTHRYATPEVGYRPGPKSRRKSNPSTPLALTSGIQNNLSSLQRVPPAGSFSAPPRPRPQARRESNGPKNGALHTQNLAPPNVAVSQMPHGNNSLQQKFARRMSASGGPSSVNGGQVVSVIDVIDLSSDDDYDDNLPDLLNSTDPLLSSGANTSVGTVLNNANNTNGSEKNGNVKNAIASIENNSTKTNTGNNNSTSAKNGNGNNSTSSKNECSHWLDAGSRQSGVKVRCHSSPNGLMNEALSHKTQFSSVADQATGAFSYHTSVLNHISFQPFSSFVPYSECSFTNSNDTTLSLNGIDTTCSRSDDDTKPSLDDLDTSKCLGEAKRNLKAFGRQSKRKRRKGKTAEISSLSSEDSDCKESLGLGRKTRRGKRRRKQTRDANNNLSDDCCPSLQSNYADGSGNSTDESCRYVVDEEVCVRMPVFLVDDITVTQPAVASLDSFHIFVDDEISVRCSKSTMVTSDYCDPAVSAGEDMVVRNECQPKVSVSTDDVPSYEDQVRLASGEACSFLLRSEFSEGYGSDGLMDTDAVRSSPEGLEQNVNLEDCGNSGNVSGSSTHNSSSDFFGSFSLLDSIREKVNNGISYLQQMSFPANLFTAGPTLVLSDYIDNENCIPLGDRIQRITSEFEEMESATSPNSYMDEPDSPNSVTASEENDTELGCINEKTQKPPRCLDFLKDDMDGLSEAREISKLGETNRRLTRGQLNEIIPKTRSSTRWPSQRRAPKPIKSDPRNKSSTTDAEKCEEHESWYVAGMQASLEAHAAGVLKFHSIWADVAYDANMNVTESPRPKSRKSTAARWSYEYAEKNSLEEEASPTSVAVSLSQSRPNEVHEDEQVSTEIEITRVVCGLDPVELTSDIQQENGSPTRFTRSNSHSQVLAGEVEELDAGVIDNSATEERNNRRSVCRSNLLKELRMLGNDASQDSGSRKRVTRMNLSRPISAAGNHEKTRNTKKVNSKDQEKEIAKSSGSPADNDTRGDGGQCRAVPKALARILGDFGESRTSRAGSPGRGRAGTDGGVERESSPDRIGNELRSLFVDECKGLRVEGCVDIPLRPATDAFKRQEQTSERLQRLSRASHHKSLGYRDDFPKTDRDIQRNMLHSHGAMCVVVYSL